MKLHKVQRLTGGVTPHPASTASRSSHPRGSGQHGHRGLSVEAREMLFTLAVFFVLLVAAALATAWYLVSQGYA